MCDRSLADVVCEINVQIHHFICYHRYLRSLYCTRVYLRECRPRGLPVLSMLRGVAASTVLKVEWMQGLFWPRVPGQTSRAPTAGYGLGAIEQDLPPWRRQILLSWLSPLPRYRLLSTVASCYHLQLMNHIMCLPTSRLFMSGTSIRRHPHLF